MNGRCIPLTLYLYNGAFESCHRLNNSLIDALSKEIFLRACITCVLLMSSLSTLGACLDSSAVLAVASVVEFIG